MPIDFTTLHQPAPLQQTERTDRADAAREAAATGETGEINGFHIETERNVAAMIADSLDEVSSMFEETEVKSLGDREIGEKRQKEDRFVQRVKLWTEKLADLPNSDVIARILRKLRNLGNPSPDQLRDLLNEASSDPTHQFAMLECLEEALEDTPADNALRETINTARQQLEEQHGPEIRVGLNLASLISEHGGSAEEMQALRDLYRGEILGFESPRDCFTSLVDKQGAEKLGEAIDFLIKACSVDMTATTPSTDPAELRRIITDLQSVEVLKTVMERFSALCRRMDTVFGETLVMSPQTMTGTVLDMSTQIFLNGTAMEGFVQNTGLRKLFSKMDFMRELTALVRAMHLRCFSDNDSRLRLIDAAQEYLDQLVAQLEEEEQQAADTDDNHEELARLEL